jgi:hypothetical protein
MLVVLASSPSGDQHGAEEQTARAISAHAQCACLLSLQTGEGGW